MDENTNDHPDPSKWWRNRRRQAHAALAGIGVIAGAAAAGITPEHANPLLQSVVWALATVVVIYSGGASAVDAMSKVRK